MTDTFGLINKIVPHIIKEQLSPSEALAHAGNALSDHLSQSTKQTINNIDALKTEEAFLDHTKDMLTSEPPSSEIVAYYLGMIDMQGGLLKKYEYQRFYLCGTDQFDADEEDWACDPAWFPSKRYYDTPLLNAIGKAQHTTDSTATYLLSLTIAAAFAIRAAPLIAAHTNPTANPVPIAIGHDSGDIFIVGYATPEGIQQATTQH